jgi:hypothetical protein
VQEFLAELRQQGRGLPPPGAQSSSPRPRPQPPCGSAHQPSRP